MRFPWWVAAIAAVGIPVTSFILGRSPTANVAVIDTPNWLFATLVLIAVAGVVGAVDPVLGLLAGYITLRSVLTPVPFAFEGAQAFVFGSLLLVCARQMPLGSSSRSKTAAAMRKCASVVGASSSGLYP